MSRKIPKYIVKAIERASSLSNEDLFEAVISDFPSDEMDALGHDAAVHNVHCEELRKRLVGSGFLDETKMVDR